MSGPNAITRSPSCCPSPSRRTRSPDAADVSNSLSFARERLDTPTSNAALMRKYDAVAYAAKSNALSHPDHMAVVATLFGLDPADVATCRVLELGCSDGANLLPMAASLPDASFVGCDLSPRAIAAAQSAVAEFGTTQNPIDALLRHEFRQVTQITDSALYHDDLAEPNDPVYFHEFAAHAARYDLRFVAEAKLSMTAADTSPAMQRFLAGCDRLEREQLLDLAQLRRFRQSLLSRGDSATGFAIAPERLALMRIGASVPLLRAAAEGKPLMDLVAPGAPA